MRVKITPIAASPTVGRLAVLRRGQYLHCYSTFMNHLRSTGMPLYSCNMFQTGTMGLCLAAATLDDEFTGQRPMFVVLIGNRLFFDVGTDLERRWELR